MFPTEPDLLRLTAEVCGEDSIDPDEELLESGLLDSFGMISLFLALEDRYGLELHPTQFPVERLSTPHSIVQLILEAWDNR